MNRFSVNRDPLAAPPVDDADVAAWTAADGRLGTPFLRAVVRDTPARFARARALTRRARRSLCRWALKGVAVGVRAGADEAFEAVAEGGG